MNFFKKHRLLFLHLLFALCLLPAMIFAYRRPYYNMDMVSYMAVVLEMDRGDTVNVHRDAYQLLRAEVPSVEYGYLTDSTGHREKMLGDAEYFKRQLPFYRVKPLYTGLSWFLFKMGFSLTTSTWMPSIIAFLLTGLLLFSWFYRHHPPLFAFITGLLLAYSAFMISVARASAPDALSAFFLLSAFFCILEKPSVSGVFLFFFLSLLTRIDNIVAASSLLLFLTVGTKWYRKIRPVYFFLMIAVLAVCYLFISSHATGGVWGILYYPDFIRRFNLSHEATAYFSFRDYFGLLYSKVMTGIVFSHLSIFALLAVLVLYEPIRNRKLLFPDQFILVLFLVMSLRFILFPDISDRFYIAYYLVIVILCIKKFLPSLQTRL